MSQADQTRSQQLQQLAQARALYHEIASAISAIEKNDLSQLERHVAAQEVLCNRLSLANRLPAQAEANGTQEPDQSLHLSREIRQAHMALAQLNRVYKAVLKRATKTVGLIGAIYRAHGQGYDRSPAPAKHQTWSCEA